MVWSRPTAPHIYHNPIQTLNNNTQLLSTMQCAQRTDSLANNNKLNSTQLNNQHHHSLANSLNSFNATAITTSCNFVLLRIAHTDLALAHVLRRTMGLCIHGTHFPTRLARSISRVERCCPLPSYLHNEKAHSITLGLHLPSDAARAILARFQPVLPDDMLGKTRCFNRTALERDEMQRNVRDRPLHTPTLSMPSLPAHH